MTHEATETVRINQGRRPALLAVLAGVLGAAAATLTLTPVATATLMKGMPITIRTERHDGVARSFALTYRPRGSARRVSDHGSAVRVIASRTVERLARGRARRHVSGREILESAQGTLTLFWNASQSRKRNSCWGRATGRWAIVSGTGLYAGRSGRGIFASNATFATVAYRGLLITAV